MWLRRLVLCASLGLSSFGASQNNLGAGLEGIADWSRTSAFADLVKQSRGFGPADAPWSGTVPVDARGWPTGDFGIILGSWPGMQNVGGTYKISFNCATTPAIATVASPGTLSNVSRNASTGMVTADLVYPASGDQLMLKFTGTQGGVRDLKIMRPGYPESAVFTTPFLDHLTRFKTLRFMDWTQTNGNPVKTWAERSTPQTPSYAANPSGVPWEVAIDLCNLKSANAWVNVPHMADDAYVASLARLVKKKLRPDLKVYVEYSNEVWNWGFAQAGWNLDQAKLEANGAKASNLRYGGETNEGVWAARRIARRAKQISDIFKAEFGATGWRTRVRTVLACQVAWPGHWLHEGLKFLNAVYGTPSNYLSAVAVAPYFNLGEANNNNALTVDDVLSALTASVNSLKTETWMEDCATLARVHGLQLVAYEGGPDTFGPNSITAKRDASLDARMRTLSVDYLKVWFGYTDGLFNWFVGGATDWNTQYGTWGLTNDMANQTAPKILAVDDARQAAPYPLNQGQAVPGNVDARKFALRGNNTDYLTWENAQFWWNDWRGRYRDYLIRTSAETTFDVDVYAGATDGSTRLKLWVGSAYLGSVPVTNTGSWTSYAYTPKLRIRLPKGMHGLRVLLESNTGVSLKQVRFTTVP